MLPLFDAAKIEASYRNEWVVLDRSWKVVGHGAELIELRARFGTRHTYYFVPAPRTDGSTGASTPR